MVITASVAALTYALYMAVSFLMNPENCLPSVSIVPIISPLVVEEDLMVPTLIAIDSVGGRARDAGDQVDAGDYARILNDQITESGRRVAIIGAGPGGLSAAYYLRKYGHAVSVFEAQSSAGGMLRYGVPSYRLADADLDKDIEYIVSLGVDITNRPAVNLYHQCGFREYDQSDLMWKLF